MGQPEGREATQKKVGEKAKNNRYYHANRSQFPGRIKGLNQPAQTAMWKARVLRFAEAVRHRKSYKIVRESGGYHVLSWQQQVPYSPYKRKHSS
jgi:hypothetical protein